MGINIEAFERELKNAGLKKAEIAEKLKIDESTLYRKLKAGGKKITVGEVHELIEIIGLSKERAAEIFLF